MAAKTKHGLEIYDLLIDIVMNLSQVQAEKLYSELLPRFTRRAKTKLYNSDGIEDKENGKIRLLESQYRALRTKFGDSYIKKAFTELTNYINYLEKNVDTNSTYKQKLKKLSSETHNILFTDGWVYEKCKNYICKDRPATVNVNPYLIDDFTLAKEYVLSLPKEMRKGIDIQILMRKYPELVDYIDYE